MKPYFVWTHLEAAEIGSPLQSTGHLAVCWDLQQSFCQRLHTSNLWSPWWLTKNGYLQSMLTVSKMFNSSSTCFTQKIAWKGVETRWSVRVFFCWMSQPMASQGKIDYCYWGLWGQVHPPSFRFCHRCRFVRMLGRCFREFGLNLGTAISIIVRVFRVVFNWCGSLGMTGCLDCRKWFAFDFGNYDAMMLMFSLLERDCVYSNLTAWQWTNRTPRCARTLAETDIAVVLITHREEEIEALGFPNVLRLKDHQTDSIQAE